MFGKKNKKTIDDEIEAYAMDTVEFIIDDLNKRGCFDLFKYFHSEQKVQHYSPVPEYTDRQWYLNTFIENLNCSYEKTLEAQRDFYESMRRG